jgi:hypothetical protein
MKLKPCSVGLYEWMRKEGGWLSVRQIFLGYPTNTPTKRLSELYRAGKIEKRRGSENSSYMVYRAK